MALASGDVGLMSSESPVSVVQEQSHDTAREWRDAGEQVELAVLVDICQSERCGERSGFEGFAEREPAVSVAQEHLKALNALEGGVAVPMEQTESAGVGLDVMSHEQIEPTIVLEITGHHLDGIRPDAGTERRLERAALIRQEHAHAGRGSVGCHEVEQAVCVDVRHRDVKRRRSGVDSRRGKPVRLAYLAGSTGVSARALAGIGDGVHGLCVQQVHIRRGPVDAAGIGGVSVDGIGVRQACVRPLCVRPLCVRAGRFGCLVHV